MQSLISDAGFARWVADSLARGENVLARRNQGTLLKFEGDGRTLLVKCPMGDGLVLRARQKTLLREYLAYQQMEGLEGVPRCYGMVDGQYLAIEYIRGVSFREAGFADRDLWFESFLAVIRGIHARGVSHGDLKTKSNILVSEDGRPYVIDFGTAFVRRTGFHPFNNWMYNLGCRLDLNAWVKHKYHGRYEDAGPEDRELLRYGWLERLVRRVRGGRAVR
ncbi:MAG: hypothetical protein R3212_06380 [Xanthomonadales bacterium]|nr:hypothetical protein [Xanthomonadales bacterium]